MMSMHDDICCIQQKLLSGQELLNDFDVELLNDIITRIKSDSECPEGKTNYLKILSILKCYQVQVLQKNKDSQYPSVISDRVCQFMYHSLGNENQHVGYLAAKCVALNILSPCMKSKSKSIIQQGIKAVLKCQTNVHLALHSLEMFQFVFSNKRLFDVEESDYIEHFQQMRILAYNELATVWASLIKRLLMSGSDSIQEDVCYALFCVWLKLLKHHNNHVIPRTAENTSPICLQAIHLLDLIKLKRIMPSHHNKAFSILHQALPYSLRSAQGYAFNMGHDLLASTILKHAPSIVFTAVTPKTFKKCPFGGKTEICDISKFLRSHPDQDMEFTSLEDGSNMHDTALLILKSCAIQMKKFQRDSATTCSEVWTSLSQLVPLFTNSESESPAHALILAYNDSDDKLVDMMLCTLEVYTIAVYSQCELPNTDIASLINPHDIFIALLCYCGHDHTTLLDLLTSPETHFLLYIVKYLHLVVNRWSDFKSECVALQSIKEKGQHLADVEVQQDALVGHLNQLLEKSRLENIQENWKSLIDDVESSTQELQKQRATMQNLMADANRLLGESSIHQELDSKYRDKPEIQEAQNESSDLQLPSSSGHEKKKPHKSDNPLASCLNYLQTKQQTETLIDIMGKVHLSKPTTVLTSYSDSESDEEDLEQNTAVGGKDSVEMEMDCTSAGAMDVDKHLKVETELESCSQNNVSDSILDKVMADLIRLRLSIERLAEAELFPFNASPLVKLISKTEELYESSA